MTCISEHTFPPLIVGSLHDPTNITILMDQQTPISARASASDPSIATQGPVPLFDIHLRFLTDSYISFFQERWVVLRVSLIQTLRLIVL